MLEDLPLGISKLRNKVIGRVLRELKFIDQWGSRIGRMIDSCEQAGVRAPIWQELGTRFRVTMFMKENGLENDDKINDPICQVLRVADGLRTAEIANAIGRASRATRFRLKKLVDNGLVARVGTSRTDPNARYYVTNR